MTDEVTTELTPQQKALRIVNNDFDRSRNYLKNFHQGCIERYKHYRAPGMQINILKQDNFPVPFTTEQIDQFTADMMDKLWFKNEPCTIYGRNKDDTSDADAKRDFMDYQDDKDNLKKKVKLALKNCALYGPAPAVVNFKQESERQQVVEDVPLNNIFGQPILDMEGNLLTAPQVGMQNVITYQGATVDLIDPIDFFFLPEKRELRDEYPIMIRSKRSMAWFKSRPYIIKKDLDELLKTEGTFEEEDDYLERRRHTVGFNIGDTNKDLHTYVEWHGMANLDGERKLWILGVADNKVLVRMDDANETFHLGHTNIVVGNIDEEYGEISGMSLLDKFHSVQHAMDSLIGMYLRALRQTVNPMWKGNSDRLKKKRLFNAAGNFIDMHGDDPDIIKRVEQEQISQDIYAGLPMFRKFGQNASGQSDISGGIVQQGVETLGEADILAGQASLRIKGGYLASFENSFIRPLWEMRNQINIVFCTDPGYKFAVLGMKAMDWRTMTPAQIRADVDFVCEASARENQRAVVTQQMLNTLQIVGGLSDVLGPVPILMLLKQLLQDGYSWKRDKIAEVIPLDALEKLSSQQQLATMFEHQQMMNNRGGGQQTPGIGGQPSPLSQGDAIQSAQKTQGARAQ
jgi:hypothetical protein